MDVVVNCCKIAKLPGKLSKRTQKVRFFEVWANHGQTGKSRPERTGSASLRFLGLLRPVLLVRYTFILHTGQETESKCEFAWACS